MRAQSPERPPAHTRQEAWRNLATPQARRVHLCGAGSGTSTRASCSRRWTWSGLGIASYLSYEELTPGGVVPCPKAGFLSGCVEVRNSPYSRPFFGIPVAVYGVILSITLFCLAIDWWRTNNYKILLAHYGLSLVGVVFEGWFQFAQIFLIHAVCIWCESYGLSLFCVSSSPCGSISGRRTRTRSRRTRLPDGLPVDPSHARGNNDDSNRPSGRHLLGQRSADQPSLGPAAAPGQQGGQPGPRAGRHARIERVARRRCFYTRSSRFSSASSPSAPPYFLSSQKAAPAVLADPIAPQASADDARQASPRADAPWVTRTPRSRSTSMRISSARAARLSRIDVEPQLVANYVATGQGQAGLPRLRHHRREGWGAPSPSTPPMRPSAPMTRASSGRTTTGSSPTSTPRAPGPSPRTGSRQSPMRWAGWTTPGSTPASTAAPTTATSRPSRSRCRPTPTRRPGSL